MLHVGEYIPSGNLIRSKIIAQDAHPFMELLRASSYAEALMEVILARRNACGCRARSRMTIHERLYRQSAHRGLRPSGQDMEITPVSCGLRCPSRR